MPPFPCRRPGSWRLQVDTSILISHVPPWEAWEDEASGRAPHGFGAVSKAMFPNEFPRTPLVRGDGGFMHSQLWICWMGTCRSTAGATEKEACSVGTLCMLFANLLQ